MLLTLQLPPGVFRNGTNYQSLGRWWDASLVRWYEGAIRPVGGWSKPAPQQMQGIARGMFPWRDNTQNRWIAIGTHSNLYVFNGGSIYNVTPAGFTAGRADGFAGVGYGFGPYGTANYGVAPAVPPVIDATTWSFDNWGQYLTGCSTSDQKIYQWELSTVAPAHPVPNAPTALATLVSAERYQFALGASGDPRHVMWSDQGDNTVWTAATLNTAGDLKLQTNGRIKTGRRLRGEVAIWTDTDLHSIYYLGPPLVYGTRRIGGFCGLIGPNAVAIIDTGAVWMSAGGFFLYDGGSVQPIACDVFDYLQGHLNYVQASKIYAGHNSKFGEVWWFYPSDASNENDRYVAWNYRENHWSMGVLDRTCWADAGVFSYPYAAAPSGYLYEQEYGWNADGAPLNGSRYLVSGPVQLGDSGDRMITLNQIVPDEMTSGSVALNLTSKLVPEDAGTPWGPYQVARYTDVRITGRQVAFELSSTADADWRVGRFRFDALQGSRR